LVDFIAVLGAGSGRRRGYGTRWRAWTGRGRRWSSWGHRSIARIVGASRAANPTVLRVRSTVGMRTSPVPDMDRLAR
jgi:hypothetical protein